MKIYLQVFRFFAAIGWLALFYISYKAINLMGANSAGDIFFADFSHPWRAQFNLDFGLHLLIVASWMIYRTKSIIGGIISGLLSIVMGGVFTILYIIIVSFKENGDFRKVLLGFRASQD